MSITVQTQAARRVRHAAESLITAVSATPPDRLHWRPLECGRPILNQAIECVFANMRWAGTIRNRALTEVPPETVEQVRAVFRQEIDAGSYTGETVKAKLREVTAELAEAILAVSEEELSREIKVGFETYLLADCFLHPYWNMVYHEGQINYIQTLYGDHEDHSVF